MCPSQRLRRRNISVQSRIFLAQIRLPLICFRNNWEKWCQSTKRNIPCRWRYSLAKVFLGLSLTSLPSAFRFHHVRSDCSIRTKKIAQMDLSSCLGCLPNLIRLSVRNGQLSSIDFLPVQLRCFSNYRVYELTKQLGVICTHPPTHVIWSLYRRLLEFIDDESRGVYVLCFFAMEPDLKCYI